MHELNVVQTFDATPGDCSKSFDYDWFYCYFQIPQLFNSMILWNHKIY